MLVDCAHYVRGIRQEQGPMTIERAAACPRRGGSFVWLELYEPGTEEMGELRAHFGLHELAVEDAARAHQRPKVEGYDDFYFIVFRTARNDARRERVEFGEVPVFLGPGYAIAVRHGDTGDLTGARRRLEQRPALLKSGPAAVVWGILDTVVDDYEPVVEALENDIEAVEQTIFAGHADAIERIHELKQELNILYRAVHPLLVPLEAMEHGAFADMDPALLRYFRDVADHLRRINEEVLARREQLKRCVVRVFDEFSYCSVASSCATVIASFASIQSTPSVRGTSSRTPRDVMPSRAHMMLPRRAPVLFTSVAAKPLYIWPSTNTWHSASMCVVAMP